MSIAGDRVAILAEFLWPADGFPVEEPLDGDVGVGKDCCGFGAEWASAFGVAFAGFECGDEYFFEVECDAGAWCCGWGWS